MKYDIKPSRHGERLDSPWNVTCDGRQYCRATSRDHAEAIAQRLNEREAEAATRCPSTGGDTEAE